MNKLPAQRQELIVRWKNTAQPSTAVGATTTRRWLAPELGIELLTYPSPASCVRAQKMLEKERRVRAVERNRSVQFRNPPNDDNYANEQGNLVRAGFEKAWALTTGGQTGDGTEIVVAILDAGFTPQHPDLAPNLWNNPGEIPGDGIDNDNNGYADDLHGWDMIGADADLPANTHGTQVTGILGARGNNGLGVAGTNWNVKLMLLAINTTADIIEAYEYIRQHRKRWNESGGSEGSLVVATNASFGIEGETCAGFTVWGDLYDELGREGILTAASTANRSWDVDVNGDMPTDCPSEYLLGVTNVGPDDVLHRSSAYGRENVDLAAPGEGSYTTRVGGTYGPFGSTSAAAPYVTGAIALLYATPCDNFFGRIRQDPAGAALLVRDALLSSVQPQPTLQFKTASGGTLDVAEAQRILVVSCGGGENNEFAITDVRPNPARGEARVTTNALVFSDRGRILLYDAYGRLTRVQSAVRIAGNPVTLRANLTNLPVGWYQLVVEERDRVARTSIIIL
ncbi:MAG: S8 family serine peptidase [Bacteroidota bacterium]